MTGGEIVFAADIASLEQPQGAGGEIQAQTGFTFGWMQLTVKV
jgi:hypothetical protein